MSLTWRVTVVMTILMVLVGGMIVVANEGHFVFSFDDPYIHLAMAEEILRGHYGINSGEAAAASSSILYPFLLAPLLAFGLGFYAALLLNFAALLGIGAVAVALLQDARLSVSGLPRLTFAIVAAVLGTGVISLAFSGLEHTLQVADALLCLLGLTRYLQTSRVSLWWIAALIAAPLIRYEGMAILAAGVLVLMLRREWRFAAIAVLIGFGSVAAFSSFLLSQGLSFLPSSVLVKSTGMASGEQAGLMGLVSGFARSLGENIQDARALPFLIGIVFVGAPFIKAAALSSNPVRWDNRAFIGLFCALVGFAHLALGAYGWFARYEIYALLILLFGTVVIYADGLAPYMRRANAQQVTWVSLAFLLVSIRFVAMVPATVTATQNIYEQQYQMHRFVTEVWRAPVAVNDLGWVSFRNDDYVLDLFGLGSEVARKSAAAHPASGEWMEPLARAHDVRLAMIFPEWLGAIPCHWVRLGELQLASKAVSVPVDHVTFYATQPADAASITAKIAAFSTSLPKGVHFEFADLTLIPVRNAFCAP